MKKVLVINFLIIFSLLFTIEIILRFLNVVGLQGYDKNFFILDKGIVMNNPVSLMKVAGIKVRTDENGFRIPLNNYNFNSDQDSVLILGDSVSFGFGVEEEETFIGILRSKFDENLLNASVIGHNLKSYKAVLQKSINMKKNIKKTIIFICLNDIIQNQGVLTEAEIKKINKSQSKNIVQKILKNDFFLKVNFYLRDKSALFVYIKSLSTNSIKRGYVNDVRPFYDNKRLLNDFSLQIDEIVSYAELKNMPIDFVLLPFAHQLNSDCKDDILVPQKIINNIFSKIDKQFYDFTTYFCNNTKNNLYLNYDPVHLSRAGHQLVSRLIIEKNLFKNSD